MSVIGAAPVMARSTSGHLEEDARAGAEAVVPVVVARTRSACCATFRGISLRSKLHAPPGVRGAVGAREVVVRERVEADGSDRGSRTGRCSRRCRAPAPQAEPGGSHCSSGRCVPLPQRSGMIVVVVGAGGRRGGGRGGRRRGGGRRDTGDGQETGAGASFARELPGLVTLDRAAEERAVARGAADQDEPDARAAMTRRA